MKKILIGTDKPKQAIYLKHSYAKLNLFNEILNIFKDQIGAPPADLKAFEKDMVNYTIKTIKAAHPGAKELGLTDDNYVKMYSYDLKELKSKEIIYNSHSGSIAIDKTSIDVDQTKDFGVYAEGDKQLQKLKDAEKLIETLQHLRDTYLPQRQINHVDYISSFCRMDATGRNLIPNRYFIKED